jgi:glycosyltransferase involved in cell wall biosynthesis
MKIAEIVCTFPPYPGGIGNVAYHNARELAQRGHEVVVFTPKQSSKIKSNKVTIEEGGFKIKWLQPILRYGNAAFLPQLFFGLKNFDIIHLHYPFFGAAEIVWLSSVIHRRGGASSRQPSVKLVITYHMDVVGKGFLGWFFRMHTKYIMPRILRRADKVIVTSFDYAENSNLAPLLKEKREKFVEVPCGVDIDKFFPRAKDSTILAKHGLSASDKIILFVGNLDRAHYFKGVDYLLDAFVILRKRLGVEQIKNEQGGKVRLLMVGSGDLLLDYKNKAKALGLADKAIFAGFISDEDLPKYYNLADIFVLPSIDQSEAFGMVAIEAMASAKPVVASDLPGVRSVVGDNATGLLAHTKNEGDLANRLSSLLADDALRQRMGEAGRKKVEEKYSWKGIGEKLESIFKSLVSF